jgi:Cof subfamily protein (haloacid dehalogenase superfamily)
VLTDAALAAIARARSLGIPVIIATGRMFRSVRPHLARAGITEPVVCYQGAAVADPVSGTFLVHEPVPLDLAREAISLLEASGHPPNCYVHDELFVAAHTDYSRQYADYQSLEVTEVGDLGAWLSEPPTKLVAVGEPDTLRELRVSLGAHFDGELFVTTSLPWLLELGHAGVSKGTGLAYVADRLGFGASATVAFGDGENDLELLEWASFGIAVEDSHPLLLKRADWVCPGPDEDGVPAVINACLDRLDD